MNRRRTIALGAAAGLSAAMVMAGPSPAGAAVPDDYQLLSGNFVGGADSTDELFYYAPGSETEALASFTHYGDVVSHDLLGSFTVNGTYKPLVGDLDGDGMDEILWYAPGTATDYLWNFTSNTSVSSVAYTANGTYAGATVGDYTGDGADDVLWYAPGPAQDYLWEYNVGGGYTSTPRTINGTYRPISGSFGNDATDDIFWYSPGTAGDYLWDFNVGTTSYSQQAFTVNGTNYRPFALDMFGDGPGNEDIFWYAPGATADHTWDFVGGDVYSYAETVGGEYLTAAGDYFGDGVDDIVFQNYDLMVLWEHTPDYYRTEWVFYPAAAAAADDRASSRGSMSGTTTGREPLPRS